MRMLRTLAMLAALAAGGFLVGCTSVPMADAGQDARLKTFPPPKPGMAGLYIYRNETFGGAIKQSLVLDGQNVGQSAPHTYFYADITPGRHTVVSQAENTETLNFDAVAGKLHFVWQEVKMGVFQARTKLSLVSEAEGRKGVQESKLAVSNLAAATPAATAPGAAQPVARASGRYDGRWSGTYRCAAYIGNAQTATPGPFSLKVDMLVDGSRASLARSDTTYREDLQGGIGPDGVLTLAGQGALARSQNQPWTTQFQGRFANGSPDRFEAAGRMTGRDGQVFRHCNLELARAAAG